MLVGVTRHRTGLVVGLLVAIPGLFLGPAVMRPSYQLMSPTFHATTLVWVELLFAFLIDFPLTTVVAAVTTAVTRSRDPRDAVIAGSLFLGMFFSLILMCVAIGARVPIIGDLALSDVFPSAVDSARDAFGTGPLAMIMMLYLLFDVTLCTLGALAGHWLGRLAAGR